ncbi:GNAT family N-acetyltransferase [Robiginitalea biformata]|uniref:Putative acetyltransferase n=1 Tax=Robiginitalea biformata (strain ATCC BAA-864 / DSM 15991 / KCTC 12146 / HTCC2501) TaxID=313596 RepID=A4CLX2_ROBBH|nr:GNAT family N-acetyltransferase [Robiginitalea biformata]EAR15871.1 putative acetyltransferase [Robiginitalea biformata HTCC2501]
MKLEGENIRLRALEPEDLEFLYALENDPEIWEISGTLTPYSKKILRQYLEVAHRDIYEAKQLRLAICRQDHRCIGLIDLFDFDPRHLRAGLGIVISEDASRKKGYGEEAIRLVCEYGFRVLGLHQIYAGVGADNAASLRVFKKAGFRETGVRVDWTRTAKGFRDEVFLQKFHPDVS